MNNNRKWMAALLAFVLLFTLKMPVSAGNEVIDPAKTGSLTIVKYDRRAAEVHSVQLKADGRSDAASEDALKDCGLAGVTFSYIRLGDIRTYRRDTENGTELRTVFGILPEAEKWLGLADALSFDGENPPCYEADRLTEALRSSLQTYPDAAKAGAEALAASLGTAMPATDATGRTSVSGLPLGLYLVVETGIPADVSVTADPFLVSLPLSCGQDNQWNYDVTVYPKNQTDPIILEKTVAEQTGSEAEFGKSSGASAGDTLLYHIDTKLQPVSGNAARYVLLRWVDELTPGLSYTRGDVTLSWYAGDDRKAEWKENEGLFSVSYADGENGSSMEIMLTEQGLAKVNSQFGGCRVQIAYSAAAKQDGSLVLGKAGNPNEVTLHYRKSGSEEKTLRDEASVYSFGLDILKKFTAGTPDASAVGFALRNDSDGYAVKAEGKDGRYIVSGADREGCGTVLHPAADGSLIIDGLEEDSYSLTETETVPGYQLLSEAVRISIRREMTGVEARISAEINGSACLMKDADAMLSARAGLELINEKAYDIPSTGENGLFLLPAAGLALAGLLVGFGRYSRKKEQSEI